MREIAIGDARVRIRANPLALLYYKQEFKRDLVGDLLTMQRLEEDPTLFDSVLFLQVVWAMAKAAGPFGSEFPCFVEWLSGLECFDLSDQEMLAAIMEEAVDGFFRRGKSSQR